MDGLEKSPKTIHPLFQMIHSAKYFSSFNPILQVIQVIELRSTFWKLSIRIDFWGKKAGSGSGWRKKAKSCIEQSFLVCIMQYNHSYSIPQSIIHKTIKTRTIITKHCTIIPVQSFLNQSFLKQSFLKPSFQLQHQVLPKHPFLRQ